MRERKQTKPGDWRHGCQPRGSLKPDFETGSQQPAEPEYLIDEGELYAHKFVGVDKLERSGTLFAVFSMDPDKT